MKYLTPEMNVGSYVIFKDKLSYNRNYLQYSIVKRSFTKQIDTYRPTFYSQKINICILL